MKPVILILSLLLSACSQLQTAESLLTTGVKNPVTPQRLYEAENAAIVLFAGLNAYKQTCVSGVIPPSCKDTIAAIQVYTRQLKPRLRTLRAFVRQNDQVNAITAYSVIQQLMAGAKSTASANGANIGG